MDAVNVTNVHQPNAYSNQAFTPKAVAFLRYAKVVEKHAIETNLGLAVVLQPLPDHQIHQRCSFESMGFTHSQADLLKEQGYQIPAVRKRIHEGFTPDEIYKAVSLKLIHDRVEIAAYTGLQDGIHRMNLLSLENKTALTKEQSKELLHKYVKKPAHVEMRSPTGYMNVRAQYLNQKQIVPIMSKVGWIVSDRDSKLTDATYETLEELLDNLDEHNGKVNEILFNAWGGPSHPENHLTAIKRKAGFTGIPTS